MSSAPTSPTAPTVSTAAPELVATWATSILPLGQDHLTPQLADALLIQNVRISTGGLRARLHLSNEHGESELVIAAASIALLRECEHNGTEPKTLHTPLRFAGAPSLSIPAGQRATSDLVDFPVAALSDIAITLHIKKAPATHSGHGSAPAVSRSFYRPAASPTPNEYKRVNRWFFISALDVAPEPDASPRGAVALFGDSITDGGVGPSSHLRWGDLLARRLHSGGGATKGIGVLNHGISGNCLLHQNSNGANGLPRLEREVLGHAGLRWLLVYLGVNDCGQCGLSLEAGQPAPNASELIAAYEQLIERAHAAGLKVYGATIPPFKGAGYWRESGEALRLAINDWARHSGRYDALIDFEATLCDPSDPSYLAEKYDTGDFLHPSAAGFRAMAESIDLDLFR